MMLNIETCFAMEHSNHVGNLFCRETFECCFTLSILVEFLFIGIVCMSWHVGLGSRIDVILSIPMFM